MRTFYNLKLIFIAFLVTGLALSCTTEAPEKDQIQFFELSDGPPKKLNLESDIYNLRGKSLTIVFPSIWHNKDVDLFLCMKNRVCFIWQSLLISPSGQLSSKVSIPKTKINLELKILLKFNESKQFEYFFPIEKIK